MNTKLRPCDCTDLVTASKLNEHGIGHNNDSITVEPGTVVLRMGHTTVRIPMNRFKMFADWYLAEQEIREKPSTGDVEKHCESNGCYVGDYWFPYPDSKRPELLTLQERYSIGIAKYGHNSEFTNCHDYLHSEKIDEFFDRWDIPRYKK